MPIRTATRPQTSIVTAPTESPGHRREGTANSLRRICVLALAFLACGTTLAAPPEAELETLLSFTTTDGMVQTWNRQNPSRFLKTTVDPAETADGSPALHLGATSLTAEGSHYFGVIVPLPKPMDLTRKRVVFKARTNHPDATRAFYVRAYNHNETKPAWSFQSWSGPLHGTWREFSLQPSLSLSGLSWEAGVVEDRVGSSIDRVEFIIGTRDDEAPVDILIGSLQCAPRIGTLQDLTTTPSFTTDAPLVADGAAVSIVLHPATAAGATAAATIVSAVTERTGVRLEARPGTPQDRQPDTNAIVLGNVNNNPAMLLLYARYFTPVDSLCPGPGGSLVHTVCNPFGKGTNILVGGATDDAGLVRAAEALCHAIRQQPAAPSLALPRLFEKHYSESFLKRYGWADDAPSGDRLAQGLKAGQAALDRGQHTSIAGVLRSVAQRYMLTGHSVEAKLYVQLWDLYAESAVADPSKFGGPWGFDSDFPSIMVVAGWDVIEEDPALTDEERIRTTKSLGRWLAEAVIPPCAGAATSTHVPHNHQTFPGLGALFAGLYFTQHLDIIEGKVWLGIADAMFSRQAGYTKPYEDCNGYQWLTNGHLMRYCLARPDFTLFENGNGEHIVNYCIGTMDNLGYQVPYGDTGSWKCWNSEMVCLDMFAFATDSPQARWAANRKRDLKNTFEAHAFYQLEPGVPPDQFNGVSVWPLDSHYYQTHRTDNRPPVERCFDKISFREAMTPKAAYLLLDGLSNGGHKHLDGNSLPRLTLYDRIWLADNDYYKAPVKFHNSVTVFRDGQSAAIPPYTELIGAGESPLFGYSKTKISDYAGVDWTRTIVWLKHAQAFVILDRLAALSDSEYQFRTLWHGVGAAELNADGLLLTQNGPTLWIQIAAGPVLDLRDDHELGKNWQGYPHAERVVRSLQAVATVQLKESESYLYASVLHGQADGQAAPWLVEFMEGADAVKLTTPHGDYGVLLGPYTGPTPHGRFETDAEVVVISEAGLSLLGATTAHVETEVLLQPGDVQDVDLDIPEAPDSLRSVKIRAPVPTAAAQQEAPPHTLAWTTKPQPRTLVLTGNTQVPGNVDLDILLTASPPPAEANVFSTGGPNTIAALTDGDWESNTATSVMFVPDETITLNIDLKQPCRIDAVRWMQWWATTSSKKTAYLLKQARVAISDDDFDEDVRELAVVTDAGPHPNFGTPIPYTVAAGAQEARYVRLEIAPQPGSAVYLSEVLVDGKPKDETVTGAPLTVTRLAAASLDGQTLPQTIMAATDSGVLIALKPDGGIRWMSRLGARINDVATADLTGDGIDEIIVGRRDYLLQVLDADGNELWKRALEYYRKPPSVNVVRTGDIDGDGTPEVIAGGENWRFYAFTATGEELWNYETVHPSRSGAVADLDGDGKAEVICGTHYYWASVLDGEGKQRWRKSFGPICYDIATGSFDGNGTRGVVFGSGDGMIHYAGHDGEKRLSYPTGDEVTRVAAADLDGDGVDEILGGSLNYNVYCFGADGQRRWRVDAGAAVSSLMTWPTAQGALVVAGTSGGRLLSITATGDVLAVTELGSEIIDTVLDRSGAVTVATADGMIHRVANR